MRRKSEPDPGQEQPSEADPSPSKIPASFVFSPHSLASALVAHALRQPTGAGGEETAARVPESEGLAPGSAMAIPESKASGTASGLPTLPEPVPAKTAPLLHAVASHPDGASAMTVQPSAAEPDPAVEPSRSAAVPAETPTATPRFPRVPSGSKDASPEPRSSPLPPLSGVQLESQPPDASDAGDLAFALRLQVPGETVRPAASAAPAHWMHSIPVEAVRPVAEPVESSEAAQIAGLSLEDSPVSAEADTGADASAGDSSHQQEFLSDLAQPIAAGRAALKTEKAPSGFSEHLSIEELAAPAVKPPRELTLRLETVNGDPVRLRLLERGGELQVAVRTPDRDLARTLHDHINDLVTRLDSKGLETELWRPQAAGSSHNLAGEDERRHQHHPRQQQQEDTQQPEPGQDPLQFLGALLWQQEIDLARHPLGSRSTL